MIWQMHLIQVTKPDIANKVKLNTEINIINMKSNKKDFKDLSLTQKIFLIFGIALLTYLSQVDIDKIVIFIKELFK